MAELLGVISGAGGLASLSMQLLESAKKLKQMYDSSKNAPETIEDLVFDLETMSLALRELERHRQHDSHNVQLLDRCIDKCRRSTAKIQELVEKMERYLTRFRGVGRMYTAFKEQDAEKLLHDLEQAKGSLSLAYQIYIQ